MTDLSSLQPYCFELENGLKVALVELAHLKRAHLTLHLHTGSAYESAAESGVSHFLEHMLFRGCAAYPNSARLATAFEELGGMLEATTAADFGTLSIDLPAQNLGLAVARLAEVIAEPLFVDLETERNIIHEEIAEDLSDEGEWVDGATLLRSALFSDGPLGQPITGTQEALEKLSEAQLRAHHARSYLANQLVLVAAGPLNTKETRDQIEAAFSKIPRGAGLQLLENTTRTGPYFHAVKQKGSQQTSLHVAFKIAGRASPDEAAIEMLLRLLDDGMSTRLYRALCDQSGLCYDASASFETYAEHGLVEFEASTSQERVAEVLAQLLSLLDEFSRQGPSEEEFQRCRSRTRWQFESIVDGPRSVAEFFAYAELKGTSPSPERRLQELLAVTQADVMRVAQATFRSENRFIVIVGAPPKAVLETTQQLALGSC